MTHSRLPYPWRKNVKRCRPTQGIHARPKWGRVNMAHPHYLTEDWRRNYVPRTTYLQNFGSMQMTLTATWRVARRSGHLIGQIFWLCGWWRLGLTLHEEGFCVGGRWFSTSTMGGPLPTSSFGYNSQPSHNSITFSCFSKSTCSPHHTVFQGNFL